jgi:Xaa-Pro aminopeptidase
MTSTPSSEIQARLTALKLAMSSQRIDMAIIIQKTDLFYFSGTSQDAHLLVPVDDEPRLLVRKSIERAVEDSPLKHIQGIKSLNDIKETVSSFKSAGLKNIGLELDVLPVNNFRMYEKMFPEANLKDVSHIIRNIRAVKSAYEIDLLRKAAEINDSMFAYAREILRPGTSEIEFAGLVEAFLRKHEHQGLVRVRSFNNEVFYGHIMSGVNLAVPSCSVGPTGGPGTNASMPQGVGTRIMQRNEPVQIDYVGSYKGYIVDQARTFFIGEAPEEFLKVHSLALDIQRAIIENGKARVVCESLFDMAMAMAEKAGYLEGFMGYPQPVPFVGHGIGLELDELPILGRKSSQILEEGMVIALEPKFIFPEKGLAGIENSFVVRKNNLERLTNFDDRIQIVNA